MIKYIRNSKRGSGYLIVLVDRFIAMSGKRPNMRLNNTDFKELLFYGVRAVA